MEPTDLEEFKPILLTETKIIQSILIQFWTKILEDAENDEIRQHIKLTQSSVASKLKKQTPPKAHEPFIYSFLLFLFEPTHGIEINSQRYSNIRIKPEQVEECFGKLDVGVHVLATASQIYNMLVEQGNIEQLWQLHYIREIHKVNRITNPISEQKEWQRYLFIETLHQTYQDAITAVGFQPKSLTRQEQSALIILSLLFDSGVLNPKYLMPLLRQLHALENYQYFKGRLFFEIITHSTNPPKKFFISKQTEVLLYRIKPWEIPLKKQNKSLHKYLLESMRAILKNWSLKVSIFPTSLLGWCRWVSLYQSKYWSPILLACNKGKHVNHSLNDSATKRLFRTESNIHSTIEFDDESTQKQTTLRSYAFSEIRKVFDINVGKSNHKKQFDEIKAKYALLAPKLKDNYLLILDWGKSYIQLDHKGQFKKNPKQILKKISAIGRHLIAVANTQFLQKISAEERAAIFREVIDQAISIKNKNDIQYHLRDFNIWLEKTHRSEKIQHKEDVFGTPSMTDMTVNANLISFDEYESIKSSLTELITKYPEDESYKVMLASLILGFRLGLRITEAIELKFIDYLFCDKSPQILIRESEERKTKSLNAKRAQKLTDFLTDDEIKLLNEHHQFQQKRFGRFTNGKNHYYFFSTDDSGCKLKSVEDIKKKLMLLIREVCKDTSLKYHHLRHSFASWHFFSSAIAELDLNIGDYFAHLPKTEAWLQHANTRKLQHLPTQLKSKKYPYWLAQRIGHGSIETTLEHYIHSVDLINMLYQDSLVSNLTINDLYGLTNIPISTLKKQNNRFDFALTRLTNSIPKLKAKKHQSLLSLREEWLAPEEIQKCIEPITANLPYYRYMSFLYHSRSMGNICNLGFTRKEVKQLTRLFQDNPAFRIRALNIAEQSLLASYLDKIMDVYQFTPNKDTGFPRPLEAILDTFKSRLHPYSSDTNSLQIQRSYHLIFRDETSGKILVEFAQKMNIPIKLILRHSGQMKPFHITKEKRYWKKLLGLKHSIVFTTQKDTNSRLGNHGRLEMVFLSNTGKKDHALYFLLVMLNVASLWQS